MTRRTALAALLGSFAADPERLLWTRTKLISIPATNKRVQIIADNALKHALEEYRRWISVTEFLKYDGPIGPIPNTTKYVGFIRETLSTPEE